MPTLFVPAEPAKADLSRSTRLLSEADTVASLGDIRSRASSIDTQPETGSKQGGVALEEPLLPQTWTRKRAGFFRPADPPCQNEEYLELTQQQRTDKWVEQLCREGAGIPYCIYVYYVFKGLSWWALFYYMVADRSLGLSDEKNVKRFIVYNVLNDVLGLGACNGPLGHRFTRPIETWWYFMTPGTICSPLLPWVASVVQKPAGVRSRTAVALYLCYLASLVRALYAPMIGHAEVLPIFAVLAVLTIFDTYPFFASRGEIYFYSTICLAFGGQQWIFGCQLVMLALWGWAAVSKIGPWFVHVFLFMLPNQPLLGLLPINAAGTSCLTRALYKDFPHDIRPAAFAKVLAFLGSSVEFVMLLVVCPGTVGLAAAGICVCYHLFIISLMPFASVFEWQYYMILMTKYLFVDRQFVLPDQISPFLATFCLVNLVMIPIVGHIFPKAIPFLIAYRPYAGNWRWNFVLFTKQAGLKLTKLRTASPPAYLNPVSDGLKKVMSPEEVDRFATQMPDQGAYASCFIPAYRVLPSVVERLMTQMHWSSSDFRVVPQEPFQNNVSGFSLGQGWTMTRDVWRNGFQHVCQFEQGECFFIQVEPVGLFSDVVEWRCFDVTVGPTDAIMHGKLKYKELMDVNKVSEFQLRDDQVQHGGTSVKGMFLTSYY